MLPSREPHLPCPRPPPQRQLLKPSSRGGPSGFPPISGRSCLVRQRRCDCSSPKTEPSGRVGPSGHPLNSGGPCRGFCGGDMVGRGRGGCKRGMRGYGLAAAPTWGQPSGRYHLTTRANPAHGWPSPWHTPSLLTCPRAPSPHATSRTTTTCTITLMLPLLVSWREREGRDGYRKGVRMS